MLSLFKSRKFWLAIITIAGLLVMLGTKQIDAKTFATLSTAAVSILVAAIAHEDNGAKSATVDVTSGAVSPPAPGSSSSSSDAEGSTPS